MACDTSAGSSLLLGNPFGDEHVIDFDDGLGDVHATVTRELHDRTAVIKNEVSVPILDPLPHLTVWSPPSSNSSSTTSTPIRESFKGPIEWSNADLMYLLSCYLPDLLLLSQLTFSPPLADLPATRSPIQLHLYKKIPVCSPPPEAFSKYAPVGTGRPQSRMLIAKSGECKTAKAARASLAKDVLSNEDFVAYMLNKYNVLTTLYGSSTDTLCSLQRGMIEMLGVSEPEWVERLEQLDGRVDGACGLEARLEVFLLGVGAKEAEEWVGVVETAVDLEEKERGAWMDVYADAAAFLKRCVMEMYGEWHWLTSMC